jgi:hypothetical protein
VARNSDDVFRWNLPTVDTVTLLPSSQAARCWLPAVCWATSRISLLFSLEISQFDPLIPSTQSQRRRPHLTAFLNLPTTLRRSLKHRWVAVTREGYSVGLEAETCGRRMSQRFVYSTLLLRTPPLGLPDGNDTDPPHAVVSQVSPKAKEPKFSAFLDKRVQLPRPPSRSDVPIICGPPCSSSSPSANP